MKKIVLASSSKTRQDVMKLFGFTYDIVKSLVEEHSDSKDPKQYVMDLSMDKANSGKEQITEKAVIIAADTVINYNNEICKKLQELGYKMTDFINK